MPDSPENQCQSQRRFGEIDAAFRAGDFDALGRALGGGSRWFDEMMPFELGLGHPLEYAIYWSPPAFIEELIRAGADAGYMDPAGFPALIATLSTSRQDRHEILRILLRAGVDPNQRGIHDWTPLHYAVSLRDVEAIRLLLDSGADPHLATRIDDFSSALEDAVAAGFEEGAALLTAHAGAAPPHGE